MHGESVYNSVAIWVPHWLNGSSKNECRRCRSYSDTLALQQHSLRLNLPLREGLIKNRYSGRTFIMPDQISRETALKLKLNPYRASLRASASSLWMTVLFEERHLNALHKWSAMQGH